MNRVSLNANILLSFPMSHTSKRRLISKDGWCFLSSGEVVLPKSIGREICYSKSRIVLTQGPRGPFLTSIHFLIYSQKKRGWQSPQWFFFFTDSMVNTRGNVIFFLIFFVPVWTNYLNSFPFWGGNYFLLLFVKLINHIHLMKIQTVIHWYNSIN